MPQFEHKRPKPVRFLGKNMTTLLACATCGFIMALISFTLSFLFGELPIVETFTIAGGISLVVFAIFLLLEILNKYIFYPNSTDHQN